ncbi:hypothetical protein [Serratia fonticola]
MENQKLKIEIDISSIDEAIEKIRQLKKELRELGLPYQTGNTLDLLGRNKESIGNIYSDN